MLLRGKRVLSIRGRDGWAPEIHVGRSIFRLGIPAAVQEMLSSAGFLTMLAVVATLGTASLAAQQIGFTALSLSFMPGFAFGIASTALVGQSIGAGRPDDARRAASIAMRWSAGWMAVTGILYFALAHQVMGVFTDDEVVARAGANALRALAIGLPFWAIWFVYGGALRGIGDTRTPLLTSGLAIWGAVGLAFVAINVTDGGLGTVWLMFLVTAPLAAFFNHRWFNRRMRAGVRSQLSTLRAHSGH
jgi:Na+-driven multidrug efflux pump